MRLDVSHAQAAELEPEPVLSTPKKAIDNPELPKAPTQKALQDKELSMLPPQLARICSCESTGKPDNTPQQFNPDGSVLHGRVDHDDIGACQVNRRYHLDAAKAQGLDIYTLEGNLSFAVALYQQLGTAPWRASRACWGA